MADNLDPNLNPDTVKLAEYIKLYEKLYGITIKTLDANKLQTEVTDENIKELKKLVQQQEKSKQEAEEIQSIFDRYPKTIDIINSKLKGQYKEQVNIKSVADQIIVSGENLIKIKNREISLTKQQNLADLKNINSLKESIEARRAEINNEVRRKDTKDDEEKLAALNKERSLLTQMTKDIKDQEKAYENYSKQITNTSFSSVKDQLDVINKKIEGTFDPKNYNTFDTLREQIVAAGNQIADVKEKGQNFSAAEYQQSLKHLESLQEQFGLRKSIVDEQIKALEEEKATNKELTIFQEERLEKLKEEQSMIKGTEEDFKKNISAQKEYLQSNIDSQTKFSEHLGKTGTALEKLNAVTRRVFGTNLLGENYTKQINEAADKIAKAKQASTESTGIAETVKTEPKGTEPVTPDGKKAAADFSNGVKKGINGKSIGAGIGAGLLALLTPLIATKANAQAPAGGKIPAPPGGAKGGLPGVPVSGAAPKPPAGGGGKGGFISNLISGGGGGKSGNAISNLPDTGNPYIDITKKIAGGGIEQFKVMDTSAANLARSLNTTYEEAMKARIEMSKLASGTASVFVTGEKMAEATIQMNKELGVAVNYDETRLTQQTELLNGLKGSKEEIAATAADLNKASLLNGVYQKDIFKDRLGIIRLTKIQTQTTIDERKVMMDIANATNSIKLNYIGQDQALAKAAASARAMGLDLAGVDKIAGSLMNFEQSISNQMTAEVLTGKTLNLERMRAFALQNDLVGVTSELNKLGVDANSYQKLNRIQQEGYAEALGMSKEEMSKMLVEQKILSSLKTSDLAKAKEEYETAIKQGKEKEFLARLGDEGLATQFKQMSMQDRMAASMEKIAMATEVLAQTLAGPAYEAATATAEQTAMAANAIQAASKASNFSIMDIFSPTELFNKFTTATAESLQSQMTSKSQGLTGAKSYVKEGVQKLAEGGEVKTTGIAQVDQGEFYAGKNSADTIRAIYDNTKQKAAQAVVNVPDSSNIMKEVLEETRQQNRHLVALLNKNTTLVLNDQVLAAGTARAATTNYGNLFNPSSATYH